MVKRAGGVVVRFGNVLGSRGSVIPIWQKQFKERKPLTITDKRMKRYWMTIPQACELVIQATKMKGTIILDMGEQRLVEDVAKEMFPGYPIRYTGAKEGEKLEEELMTLEESKRAIKKGKFYIL